MKNIVVYTLLLSTFALCFFSCEQKREEQVVSGNNITPIDTPTIDSTPSRSFITIPGTSLHEGWRAEENTFPTSDETFGFTLEEDSFEIRIIPHIIKGGERVSFTAHDWYDFFFVTIRGKNEIDSWLFDRNDLLYPEYWVLYKKYIESENSTATPFRIKMEIDNHVVVLSKDNMSLPKVYQVTLKINPFKLNSRYKGAISDRFEIEYLGLKVALVVGKDEANYESTAMHNAFNEFHPGHTFTFRALPKENIKVSLADDNILIDDYIETWKGNMQDLINQKMKFKYTEGFTYECSVR